MLHICFGEGHSKCGGVVSRAKNGGLAARAGFAPSMREQEPSHFLACVGSLCNREVQEHPPLPMIDEVCRFQTVYIRLLATKKVEETTPTLR